MADPFGFVNGQKRGDIGVFDGVGWKPSGFVASLDPTSGLMTMKHANTDALASSFTAVAPLKLRILDGSDAVPETAAQPTVQIARVTSMTSSPNGGDAAYSAALAVENLATSSNTIQAVGVYGVTRGTGGSGTYMLGGVFVGWQDGGTGSGGQGAYIIGNTSYNNAGAIAQALAVELGNFSAHNFAYNSNGSNNVFGQEIVIRTGGASNYSAVGLQIRFDTNSQLDVGFAITATGAGIRTAGFEDDSNSPTVFKITGSHTDGIDFTGGTFSGSMIKFPAWSTTWTPSFVSDSGTLTTVTVNSKGWLQLGKTLFFHLDFTVTNHGTAGGRIAFSLPNSLTSKTVAALISGSEQGVTGKGVEGWVSAAGAFVTLVFDDGLQTTATTSGYQFLMGGCLEVA